MGSVSEPSAALSLLLILVSLLLLRLLSLLLLLMLLSLLILLALLLLLLLFETEVLLFSARAGWRGTIMAERAMETIRSILRSLGRRFKSSLSNVSSQVEADQVSDTGVRGGRRMTGGGHHSSHMADARHTSLSVS